MQISFQPERNEMEFGFQIGIAEKNITAKEIGLLLFNTFK